MNREQVVQENKDLASAIVDSIMEQHFLSKKSLIPLIVSLLNAFRIKEVIPSKDQWKKHDAIQAMQIKFWKDKCKEIYPESMMQEFYQELTKLENDANRNY